MMSCGRVAGVEWRGTLSGTHLSVQVFHCFQNFAEKYVVRAVSHVAVEKNIVLTVVQVGRQRLAILLLVLVAVHAEGLSLGTREIQRLRIPFGQKILHAVRFPSGIS